MNYKNNQHHFANSIPGKIVVIYAIVSGLWIFFSDSLLEALINDPHLTARISIVKGWLFVLVTSTLLFYLIKRYVTHLKNIHEELHESERRFRELMERVHMIAIMLNIHGNIIFCNDYLQQMTGWSRNELLEKNWFDTFLPSGIKDQVKSIFIQGITNGEIPFHYENSILTKTGKEHMIVWDNTILLSKDGINIGMASLGMDITEHRKTEAQLRQSQKMESIGTLAGGIAHDFNNILTVILSSCEMLRTKPDDHERSKLLLNQIDNAARKAANLTRSLLAFSRKQVIKPQPINLNNLVNQMQEFLQRIIGERIELKINHSEEQLHIFADQGQMEQVIMNLAVNARDAMPEGGTLYITTELKTIEEESIVENNIMVSGEFAQLTMADSGTGIPPEIMDRIFEPFFTTKPVDKGTGLGLSMVHGIVKQHNGWITVSSKTGSGSSFTVYLPLHRHNEAIELDKYS